MWTFQRNQVFILKQICVSFEKQCFALCAYYFIWNPGKDMVHYIDVRESLDNPRNIFANRYITLIQYRAKFILLILHNSV